MLKPLNWAVARTSTLLQVVCAPESAFTGRLDGPSYLLPLVILGLSFALLSLLQAPLSIQWAQHQMSAAGAPKEQVAASMDMMLKAHRWAVAFVPPLLLLKWLFVATGLWLMSRLFLANVGFSRLLSIVAYSYFPMLLRETALLSILWMRGREALHQPDAMNVAIGLDLLLPRLPLPWSTLIGNLNIFEFWYVALLTVGLSKAAGTSRQKALAMTLPNWLFALLIQFGFVSLTLSLRSSLGL
ncbi:MAG: YIP1 family protein [Acidobacteriota bacterium]